MPRPILLDVDTGTDDALAILYAVAHPDLEVLGISCVAGNSGLDHVVTNTLKVLDAAGAHDIPVAGGAGKPLLERTRPEGAFHGADGLGGIALPDSLRKTSRLGAIEMLYQQIRTAAEPVTLVTLAPQTNIALLISQHPDVADHLERIIFMGGSAGGGNVTAVAEFNVWQDPEAASCVIESGVPTTMYGLDVFTRLAVGQGTADHFREDDHPARRLAGQLLYLRGARAAGSGQDYLGLIGDAGALVMLTNPELFTLREHPVRVNLGGIGRGQTIVDRRAVAQDAGAWTQDPWPAVNVALDLDVPAAAAVFTKTIEGYR